MVATVAVRGLLRPLLEHGLSFGRLLWVVPIAGEVCGGVHGGTVAWGGSGVTSTGGVVDCGPATSSVSTRTPIETGTIKGLRIVMVPKYETETRAVCSTEYRTEERTRSYVVHKTVPVTEETRPGNDQLDH